MKKFLFTLLAAFAFCCADVVVNTTGSVELMSQDDPVAVKCNVDDSFVEFVQESKDSDEKISVEDLCKNASDSTEEERKCKTNVPKQIKCVEKELLKRK